MQPKVAAQQIYFSTCGRKHLPEWEECVALRDAKRMYSPSTSKTSGAKKKQITLVASFLMSRRGLDGRQLQMRKIWFQYTQLRILDSWSFWIQNIIFCRKHFAHVSLPHLYNTSKESVSKKLQNTNFSSITTDIWSRRTLQPYLSLTVHFIDRMDNGNCLPPDNVFPRRPHWRCHNSRPERIEWRASSLHDYWQRNRYD